MHANSHVYDHCSKHSDPYIRAALLPVIPAVTAQSSLSGRRCLRLQQTSVGISLLARRPGLCLEVDQAFTSANSPTLARSSFASVVRITTTRRMIAVALRHQGEDLEPARLQTPLHGLLRLVLGS